MNVRILSSGAAGEALAERVTAEAFAAGATGLEEHWDTAASARHLWIYSPSETRQSVERAVRAFPADELAWIGSRIEPEIDWVSRAKDSIEAVAVGDQLLIRPSWKPSGGERFAAELVIDPGQAFGTGGHASTRLVLSQMLNEAERLAGASVLDVGCGSGVLALTAAAFGAGRIVAFDLDPLAVEATGENAESNGLSGRLRIYCGGIDALDDGSFDLVLANLLRSELEPILPALALRVASGGRLILAGLLESDASAMAARGEELGLQVDGRETLEDPSGESWLALVMSPTAGASTRVERRGSRGSRSGAPSR